MAETKRGGVYLSEDGLTWHDANGKVIGAEPVVVGPDESVTPEGGSEYGKDGNDFNKTFVKSTTPSLPKRRSATKKSKGKK